MRKRILKLRTLFEHDLWHSPETSNLSIGKRWVRWLRILSLTFEGSQRNDLLTRAAALSFASLIGLGPLVAIAVLITGSFVQTDLNESIRTIINFVAPFLSGDLAVPTGEGGTENELDLFISQIVTGAESVLTGIGINTEGSSVFQIFGLGLLFWVGINLLTTIEKTFNAIWGVSIGRNWGQRIVSYWTFLSLGTIIAAGSTALFSASAYASYFDAVPFGENITYLMVKAAPLIVIFLLTGLLTFAYQFFPNTAVRFKPALTAAVAVAVGLMLINVASFLYLGWVIRMKSFFGSLAIVFIIMMGLYLFWSVVLVGAQLTHALQNVEFLTRRQMWKGISVQAREVVTLGIFIHIARRFQNCETQPSAEELSHTLKVPGNVINPCLQILTEENWIVPVVDNSDVKDPLYRPSKPLSRLNLVEFRETFARHGSNQGVEFVSNSDPLLGAYLRLPSATDSERKKIGETNFDALFQEYPAH
jgi:membrane protein|tara:strand:+ start:17757 stop:19184 length:1428 start_codon:yes stop_codon:yes gene_type:complete